MALANLAGRLRQQPPFCGRFDRIWPFLDNESRTGCSTTNPTSKVVCTESPPPTGWRRHPRLRLECRVGARYPASGVKVHYVDRRQLAAPPPPTPASHHRHHAAPRLHSEGGRAAACPGPPWLCEPGTRRPPVLAPPISPAAASPPGLTPPPTHHIPPTPSNFTLRVSHPRITTC